MLSPPKPPPWAPRISISALACFAAALAFFAGLAFAAFAGP